MAPMICLSVSFSLYDVFLPVWMFSVNWSIKANIKPIYVGALVNVPPSHEHKPSALLILELSKMNIIYRLLAPPDIKNHPTSDWPGSGLRDHHFCLRIIICNIYIYIISLSF